MRSSVLWLKQPIACLVAALLMVPLAQAATDPLPSAPLPQATAAQQAPQGATGAQNQQPAGQQNTAPVGTAAAPVVKPEGTAVSRPAGAAIAPAQQKRRHTIVLRTALLIGGAIAIGTVAAASLGSPARPH